MKTTRILLVDDDDALRSVLARILKQCGYEVQEACNGKDALESYDRFGADLLVMDVIMPEKDGMEILMELGRRPVRPRIIVMSGGGQISSQIYLRIAKAQRADCVLEKPFSCEDLLSAVDTVSQGLQSNIGMVGCLSEPVLIR